MSASLQVRPQNRDLGTMVRDVDENLAIYLGVRKVEEEIISDHLLDEDIEELRLFKTATDDNPLGLETDKENDDDDGWLLTRANPSVIPATEAKGQDPAIVTTSAEAISLKSEKKLGIAARQESDSSRCKPQPNKRPSSSSSSSSSISRKPNNPRSTMPSNTIRQSLPSKSKPSLPSSKPKKAGQTRSSTPNKGTAKVAPKSQTAVNSRPSLEAHLSKSHNGPQSLKTPSTVTKRRPLSASRARPSPTNNTSSPSSTPAKTGVGPFSASGNKTGMLSRVGPQGYKNDNGADVNPVVMGTKMVERVVNMRKLAPPKKKDDECVYYDEKPKKNKPSNKDSSGGFGRSLSNKSLDMALRHMVIGNISQ